MANVEWNAADYHQRSALQQWLAETSLEGLDLTGAGRILDLGCGDGAITAEIAARAPAATVLGVDPSQRMIDYAASHFAGPNLRFAVGDARVPEATGPFDLIVSFNALHWVAETELAAVAKALYLSLAPGGRVFLQFVGGGPRRSLEDVLQDVATSGAFEPWFRDFAPPFSHPAPEQWRRLLEAAGLTVDSLELADRRWDFGSVDAFRAWGETCFVTWTSRLPEARRADFAHEVLERYGRVAGEPGVFLFYQMLTRAHR
jgi:trans-aconitate 2-methyltransferase